MNVDRILPLTIIWLTLLFLKWSSPPHFTAAGFFARDFRNYLHSEITSVHQNQRKFYFITLFTMFSEETIQALDANSP
jgi:hypothetical protein